MPITPLLEGLPPIVGDSPRLLILGNMPSAISLATQEYYGNPRNTFWRIAGELLGLDPAAAYTQRTEALRRRGVAVWDVLKNCRRVGSLDSAVEPDSMVANDFVAFFAEHRLIAQVVFNGAAAQRNFTRLVGTKAADAAVTFARLPSTSPAHTMPHADKVAAWRVIRDL